ASEVDGLVQRAEAAGLAPADAVKRATTRWLEQVRAGAIGPVGAAVTELAVAPLPLPAPRGNQAEPDGDAIERYASGVLSSLARTGINRRLTELRSRQRRMSPDDAGYRDLFEEIVGLENRRMQMARQG
ncbi:DNA primase, partial [Actinomyces sp. MRS3W]|nr:DNA primase [Actinomyces sp. MRS3W]